MQQSAATAAFCDNREQADAVGEQVDNKNTTASGEMGHGDTAKASEGRVSVKLHEMNVWESNGRWETWAPVRLGIDHFGVLGKKSQATAAHDVM